MFPGQKVLGIYFLRPSKLRIMEDASAFKDGRMQPDAPSNLSHLALPPQTSLQSLWFSRGGGEGFLLQLGRGPYGAWGKHRSCGCGYLLFPLQRRSVLNFSVLEQ